MTRDVIEATRCAAPTKTDRILLALELVFGVLPITIVGGAYSLIGLLSGGVWFVMSVRALTFDAVAWWLAVIALAAGGLVGIAGVWSLMLISASSRPPAPPAIRLALGGSTVGVITAVSALLLIADSGFEAPRYVLYGLVAPIVVVLHRGPALARRL